MDGTNGTRGVGVAESGSPTSGRDRRPHPLVMDRRHHGRDLRATAAIPRRRRVLGNGHPAHQQRRTDGAAVARPGLARRAAGAQGVCPRFAQHRGKRSGACHGVGYHHHHSAPQSRRARPGLTLPNRLVRSRQATNRLVSPNPEIPGIVWHFQLNGSRSVSYAGNEAQVRAARYPALPIGPGPSALLGRTGVGSRHRRAHRVGGRHRPLCWLLPSCSSGYGHCRPTCRSSQRPIPADGNQNSLQRKPDRKGRPSTPRSTAARST